MTALSGLRGVFGRPFLRLDDLLDLSALDVVHEEICLGLARSPTSYTGGSHRSMGIMPETRRDEALVDYQEVIRALDDEGFDTFRDLADDPSRIDASARGSLEFGEEREVPLSMAQMLWLKMRHRVYFPWKVYAELIPNDRWESKADATGKRWRRTARDHFPRTIAFVEKLPFESIGRCNIMGLEANDHGTTHRDGDASSEREPDQFITFVPSPGKRLYLYDASTRQETDVTGRSYWFHDHDYHGVRSDPFFRYSVRVDGIFEASFRDALEKLAHSQ